MIRASLNVASDPECRESRGVREVRVSCLEDIAGIGRQVEVSGSPRGSADDYWGRRAPNSTSIAVESS
jgi:hypothetical protein